MALATDREQAERLLTLHRSLGVVSWAVAIGRLCWRLLWARVPPLPASTRPPQRAAAWLVEYGLYAILLFQPLTGLAHSLFRGRPFMLFLWEFPKTVARDKALSGLFERIHGVTAWVLLGLIGLHVGAALFHRFVVKDQVLQAMLPWTSSIQKTGRRARGGPLQARNDAT
jgi:cytochrome b561